MSDSHGLYSPLEEVVERNPEASMFIHLGDGEEEVNTLREIYPDLDIRHVAGNCDFSSRSEQETVITAGKYRIYAAHGHNLWVKNSLEPLKQQARLYKAKIALFGHTHSSYQSYEDGLYIMNPGSLSCPRDGKRPSYGFIDITDSGIVTNIVNLY